MNTKEYIKNILTFRYDPNDEFAETKLGFSHDVRKEFISENIMSLVNFLLNDDRLIYEHNIINKSWINRHITEKENIAVLNKLLQIYALELWMELTYV